MKKQNEDGFTLLEVLLAIVLFSIAISLFSLFFVNSFKQSKTQDQELVAMNLARQVAEEWRSGAGDLTNAVSTEPLPANKTNLAYDDLLGIINHSPFFLKEETINERKYIPMIEILPMNRDPQQVGTDPEPVIIIKVIIFTADKSKELAALSTSVGNPLKGDGNP